MFKGETEEDDWIIGELTIDEVRIVLSEWESEEVPDLDTHGRELIEEWY